MHVSVPLHVWTAVIEVGVIQLPKLTICVKFASPLLQVQSHIDKTLNLNLLNKLAQYLQIDGDQM